MFEVRTAAGHHRLSELRLTGFTLIELLVVIAIIALLMSILMPALGKANQQAKGAICLSRLHQWGFFMQMYTEDYDGLFMAGMGYEKYAALGNPELKEYYENDKMLLCPMATKTYEEGVRNPFGAWRGSKSGDPLGNLPCSYGINSWIVSKPCASGTELLGGQLLWKTPNVKAAARVPMIVDCAGYENACVWHKDEPPEYDGHWVKSTNISEMRYVCLNRHNEHINGVFCDFNARKIGLKELWELRWHRNWYKGTGNVPNYDPPVWPPWMEHMKDYAY
jgi:prepilin-type N-terminal cleavage/methylation domain-containing protein